MISTDELTEARQFVPDVAILKISQPSDGEIIPARLMLM